MDNARAVFSADEDLALAKFRRADIPGVFCVVDDRVARAPTKRVIVLVAFGAKHQPAIFKNFYERLVGIFKKQSGDRLDRIDKVSAKSNPVYDRKIICLAERKVVDTVRRCGMDNARAVFSADEVSREHLKCVVGFNLEIIEQPFIPHADQVFAFDGLDHGVFEISHDCFAQRLGNDQHFAIDVTVAVVDIVSNGERYVRRQRPRRRCPDKKRCVVLADDFESYCDRRVFDFLVAQRELMRRERCADARIVRDDLVATIN